MSFKSQTVRLSGEALAALVVAGPQDEVFFHEGLQEEKRVTINIHPIPGDPPGIHGQDFGRQAFYRLLLSAINRLTYLGAYAIDIACKKSMLAPFRHLRKNICAN